MVCHMTVTTWADEVRLNFIYILHTFILYKTCFFTTQPKVVSILSILDAAVKLTKWCNELIYCRRTGSFKPCILLLNLYSLPCALQEGIIKI